MSERAVRDRPVWQLTLLFSAVWIGAGVLVELVHEWATAYLGPNARFVLWGVLGLVALGWTARARSEEGHDPAAPEGEREDRKAATETRERRFRLGFLLAWALVGLLGVLVEGGVGDLVEAVRALPPGDLPVVAVLLAHVALLVLGMAVALTDRWPIYTVLALALFVFALTSIPDPGATLAVGAALLVLEALVLTRLSPAAAVWFCAVVGGDWLLWTMSAGGADGYGLLDGLAGAGFAAAAAFLSARVGRRRQVA